MRSTFADRVNELAWTLPETSMPSGAKHSNRIAISEVYAAYCAAYPHDHYARSLGNFKTRLIEMAKARLITLRRADLPERLHQGTREASETKWGGEEVHFVLRRERSASHTQDRARKGRRR